MSAKNEMRKACEAARGGPDGWNKPAFDRGFAAGAAWAFAQDAGIADRLGATEFERWKGAANLREPYASNRIRQLGWEIADAIRKLAEECK